MSKPEPVELKIEKLSLGGDGIARKDGLVYFVPMTAPGDLILAQVQESKKNFARAHLLKLMEASPHRIEAPCVYFGRCGGCSWQHIDYKTQVEQKAQIVREQLRAFQADQTEFHEIVSSPRDFRYRNRIQLKYKKPNLGFYARRSHEIIDIKDCLITEEALTAELPALRKTLTGKNEDIPKIELMLNTEDKVEVSFEDSPFEGGGFSQVNRFQNENLVSTTIQWAQRQSHDFFYDLYSGAGNFTFPLKEAFAKASGIGVELNAKSVGLARQKAQHLGGNFAKDLRFFASDVELFLKRNTLKKDALVLLDPPRVGCSELTMKYLGEQEINRILYVSCNPASLARDIQWLKRYSDKKWRLSRVQAFDMFPQTDHVEVLAELIVDTRS